MLRDKNYDFSFSGLKTSVLYYLRDHPLKAESSSTLSSPPKSSRLKANIAASFQQAAIDVLVTKTARAVNEFGAKSIMLSGGVAANAALRSALQASGQKLEVNFFAPPASLNTDNAAVIGAAGYIAYLQKEALPLSADGNLNL